MRSYSTEWKLDTITPSCAPATAAVKEIAVNVVIVQSRIDRLPTVQPADGVADDTVGQGPGRQFPLADHVEDAVVPHPISAWQSSDWQGDGHRIAQHCVRREARRSQRMGVIS